MKHWLLVVAVAVLGLSEVSFMWGRSFVVATHGNDDNAGTFAEPWRTIDKANRTLVAGDTVYIMTGIYTAQINPENSGSAGNPLVYMNYQADVCSLYINNTVISLTNKSYIIVQGLRLQMAHYASSPAVSVTGGSHNAILDCYIYGGSTHNNPAWGDWPAVRFSGTDYNRFIGNFVDRQDHDITSDQLRGDGICVFGNSRFNIIEGNTIVNVSHFGIAVPYGVPGDSYNIVRNNRAYDCHVGIGNTDHTSRCLYEGNLAWSPGEVDTYRGGVSCEFSPHTSIIRYNAFYDDSTSTGSLERNPGSNNSFVTNTSISTPVDNRVYHNVFMGKSGTAADRHSLLLQNDNPGVWDFGRNVFVNNIIAYPNTREGSYPISWIDRGKTFSTVSDTFRCNLVWSGTTGGVVAFWGTTGPTNSWLTLEQLKYRMPIVWAPSNFEGSPMWRDSIGVQERRDFTLSEVSPCIDRAVPLTATVQPTNGSDVIQVSDASYFHYAWGDSPYDRGDSISVDGVRAELRHVDYDNNILYTTENVTVGANRGVFIAATYSTVSGYQQRMVGSAPDVGIHEYDADGANYQTPAAPILPALSVGSAPLPLTALVQWSNPRFAMWYQIQISTSASFTSNVIDETGVTATVYPISALGSGTSYFVRVRAFNSMGASPWSAVATFTTMSGSENPGKGAKNLVDNGGFESGLTGWGFFTNGEGTFDATTAAYEGTLAGKVSIAQVNDNIQVYRTGLTVEPSSRYRLTFAARSMTGHDFNVSLLKNVAPYTNYGLRSAEVDLDTMWKSFSLNFDTENFDATVFDARLRFWFPPYASPGDEYVIDDIVLTLLGASAAESINVILPERYMLSQNYPNPFNPRTTIQFALSKEEHVSLKVYDLKGAEVAVLCDVIRSAGVHQSVFEPGNLASGTYIYELKTNTYRDTRKMLLLR